MRAKEFFPWLRWHYKCYLRQFLRQGRGTPVTMSDIEVLYKTKHFLVVNKRYDVKVYSNEPKDFITVEKQLKNYVPDYISDCAFGFR